MKKVLQKGFTLIELIIVIAIIAILAVGVIAALNPAEQNNRAGDARALNSQGELMSAIQRLTAVNNGQSPFINVVANATNRGPARIDLVEDETGGATADCSPATSCVWTKLTNANEINANFIGAFTTAADNLRIYATYNNTAQNGYNAGTVTLCYFPRSSGRRALATNNRWCNGATTGTNPVGCPATVGSDTNSQNWECINQ